MQKTKNKLDKISRYIKPIFMISISILVIVECIQLRKTVSNGQLLDILSTISFSRIIIMIVVGIISVLPMVGYDYTLNQLLGHSVSWRFLLPTSWSINTLNNLLGMGGLINTGLRMEFYKKNDESSVTILKRIAQVMLYMLFGLSFYALINFIGIWIVHSKHHLQYWPILLAGSAYFPLMLLFVNCQKKSYFKDFNPRYQSQLAITSIIEWTGVIVSFLVVGYAMGVKLSIFPVVAILIVAMLVGMVSFIPGGIGSFDLVLIGGMVGLGYSKETVIIWALLFRLVYYVIPFLIGILCLIQAFGQRINQKYDGLPGILIKKVSFSLFVMMLYSLGIFLIWSSTIPEEISHLRWLTWIDPSRRSFYAQIPGIILGYIFLLLARITKEKVKRVIGWLVVISGITLIYLNIPTISWQTSIFIIITLLLLFKMRHQFYREQFIYAYEMCIVDIVLITFITLVYLYYLTKHLPHSIHFWQREFYILAFENTWLYIMAMILIIALCYYIILKKHMIRKVKLGSPFEVDRYSQFLKKYGGNNNAGLAYLNDKRLYWYQVDNEDVLVFQYQLYNNKCVVMGSPIGDLAYMKEGVKAFLNDLDRLHYQAVFYEVDANITMFLHEFGFEFIKFGEDAEVNLETFTLQGKKNKTLRNMRNHAVAGGLSFEVIYPPYSNQILDQIKEVSDAWLGNRLEKGFSLGFFDRDYIKYCPLAIVYNEEKQIVAFANVMPNEQKNHVSIDLMRYDPNKTVNGAMDYIFIELFLYYKGKGEKWFDMGMAPLSNVGDVPTSFIQERFAYLIYRYGTHFYSFEGLKNYKEKYSPRWTPRYTCYASKSWLITSILTVFFLTQKTSSSSYIKSNLKFKNRSYRKE